MLDLEDVHRGRAGLDVDLTKFLRHSHGFQPVGLAGLGGCIDGSPAGFSRLRRETMVGCHPIRPEGVQTPVLEKDLHRSAKGGGAGGKRCGGGQLVVGP